MFTHTTQTIIKALIDIQTKKTFSSIIMDIHKSGEMYPPLHFDIYWTELVIRIFLYLTLGIYLTDNAPSLVCVNTTLKQ